MKARKKRWHGGRGLGRALEPSELAELAGPFEELSLDEAMDARLREEDAGEGGWLDVVEKEG